MEGIGALPGDLTVLVVLTAIGAGIGAFGLGRGWGIREVGISFGLGAGVFSWVLFVMSWSGVTLSRPERAVDHGCALCPCCGCSAPSCPTHEG